MDRRVGEGRFGNGDLCPRIHDGSTTRRTPKRCFSYVAFLKSKHNAVMVFDPSEPEINESEFQREDWSATPYGKCMEDIAHNSPEPLGIGFTMRAFVDSDHAGDYITRRSRTGFIIFLNSAPIYWYSKKQGSCETSTFGSEFIAMKSCCEYIRGLRLERRDGEVFTSTLVTVIDDIV